MTYPCDDCGKDYHDFHVSNEIWNAVIQGTPISHMTNYLPSAKYGAHGLLCYTCFCDRVEEAGYVPVFNCELAHPSRRMKKFREKFTQSITWLLSDPQSSNRSVNK